MKRRLMLSAIAITVAGGTAVPAEAAPWMRGFVVGTYEYAFHYGGRAGYSGGGDRARIGLPAWQHDPFLQRRADPQMRSQLQAWRSAAGDRQDRPAAGAGPGSSAPVATRFLSGTARVSYRGWRHGIETYVNPFATLDPGEPEVTGRIADGFNLDGKIGANDFVSPDGEKGVDNALYRAWGCDAPWRGNGNATLDLRANDKMQEGLYTMVIRISGNQDPMNDNDVTLEIGYSPDNIVKDARGGVGVDFSYRIVKAAQYTKMKAMIRGRRGGNRTGAESAYPAHRLVL